GKAITAMIRGQLIHDASSMSSYSSDRKCMKRYSCILLMLFIVTPLVYGCDSREGRSITLVAQDRITMAEMLERIRATARDNQGRWPSRTDLMDETLIRSKDVLYGADGLVSCFSQPT